MTDSCKLTQFKRWPNYIFHHSLWQLSNFPAHLMLKVFLYSFAKNMKSCSLYSENLDLVFSGHNLLIDFQTSNLRISRDDLQAAYMDQTYYLLWSWTARLDRKCLFPLCFWVAKSEIDENNSIAITVQNKVPLLKLVQTTPKKWEANGCGLCAWNFCPFKCNKYWQFHWHKS